MSFKLNFDPTRGYGTCSGCMFFRVQIGANGDPILKCDNGWQLKQVIDYCPDKTNKQETVTNGMKSAALIRTQVWNQDKRRYDWIWVALDGNVTVQVYPPPEKETAGFKKARKKELEKAGPVEVPEGPAQEVIGGLKEEAA